MVERDSLTREHKVTASILILEHRALFSCSKLCAVFMLLLYVIFFLYILLYCSHFVALEETGNSRRNKLVAELFEAW